MIGGMIVLFVGGIEIVSMLEAYGQWPNWTIVGMGCCACVPDRSHFYPRTLTANPLILPIVYLSCLVSSSSIFIGFLRPLLFVGPEALQPFAFSRPCCSSTIQVISSNFCGSAGNASFIDCCRSGEGALNLVAPDDSAIGALEGMGSRARAALPM
jgi:hypothetical protein